MKLSEQLIRESSSERSFARGANYYHSGQLVGLEQRGSVLLAAAQGSEETPYRVLLEEPYEAACTCPYDYGGWCKHIVAVLLAYQPGLVVVKPALETLLEPLSEARLRGALLHVLVVHPETLETLEDFLDDADAAR